MSFIRNSILRLSVTENYSSVKLNEQLNRKLSLDSADVKRKNSDENFDEIIYRRKLSTTQSIFSNDSDLTSLIGDLVDSGNNYDTISEIGDVETNPSYRTYSYIDKLHLLINKLNSSEDMYIKALEEGISTYVTIMSDDRTLPISLKGHKYTIFSLIENLYNFHKNRVQPALKSCGYNVDEIFATFQNFIDNNYFYLYCLYLMNKKRSDRLIKKNSKIFEKDSDRNIGLLNFLFLPTPKLIKYRRIIEEMVKVLKIYYETNDELKKQMDAGKKLIDDMQEVIRSCIDSSHLGRIDFEAYECFIDIKQQGRFIKCDEFEINETKTNKKFRGKVFLFEKILIYTEHSEGKRKRYMCRGFYSRDTMGFHYPENNKKKFSVFTSKYGNDEREFIKTETNVDIEYWVKTLKNILITVTAEERKKIQNKTRRTASIRLENTKVMLDCKQVRRSSSSISSISDPSSLSSASSPTEFDTVDEEYRLFETPELIQKTESSEITPTTPEGNPFSNIFKLKNIIYELQDTEKDYLQTLKSGIENYVSIMTRNDLPAAIRGHKFSIFSVIEKIYEFHKNLFSPALENCADNPEKIFDLFLKSIERKEFYIYILYSMNNSRSEALFRCNRQFFNQRATETKDKLGPLSFLTQPMRRLTKYRLLLAEIIKVLIKNNDAGAEFQKLLAAGCRAEKSLQTVLDAANNSIRLEQIRFEKNGAYINVMHQGRFLKCDEFEIFEPKAAYRRYRGKVFLFEKTLIYTEFTWNKNKFNFRGYFTRETMGISFRNNTKNKFILFNSKQGNEEVEFIKRDSTVDDWLEAIRSMLMAVVDSEKAKIQKIMQRRPSIKVDNVHLTLSNSFDETDSIV